MDGLDNIFARNCSVRRIDKPVAAAFLDANHRMGDASCRYRYGLFVERTTGRFERRRAQGTLVAVAGFSSARRRDEGGRRTSSYEWVRYASLKGIRVVGGMGKLLQAFIDAVDPDDVMTYSDPASPDNGNAYRRLGFTSEGITEKPAFRCEKFRLVRKR